MYQVNTLYSDGEIRTSDIFDSEEHAQKYYESIGEDTNKELLRVDFDGNVLEFMESNYD